jgi:uncharacterized membrane protein YfcA
MQLPVLAFALSCIFAAAVVRGYAGFGFSLLSITALSIAFEPRQIIPTIFILEVCASVHLLAISWRHVHWQALGWLVVGCMIGTPIGVYALARAPAAPLKVALASVVLVIAMLLSRGFALESMPGRLGTAGTGLVSGVLNGALGVGGPPVVILFFGTPTGAATGRASMIAYFLFTDLLGLGWQWHDGLLERQAVARALLYAPALIAGVFVGNRMFARIDPARFRVWVLRLLIALAALSGVRALWQPM